MGLNWFMGFCAKQSDEVTGLTVFPCSFSVEKIGDEIEVTIYDYSYREPDRFSIFYIGVLYDGLAERIRDQFIKHYNVIPSENDIKKLLEGKT